MQVSIREFRSNISKYVAQVQQQNDSVEITRHGRVVAVVLSINKNKVGVVKLRDIKLKPPKTYFATSAPDSKLTRQIEKRATKRGLKLCKHGFGPGLCKFGCK
jgi:prevent-host-death family protein